MLIEIGVDWSVCVFGLSFGDKLAICLGPVIIVLSFLKR